MDFNLLSMGGMGIFAAATLGGITGFGYGLAATSLLLLAGLPLPQVVVVNLTVALLTRIVVVCRFRKSVQLSKAGRLVVGGLPGICLGLVTIHLVDTRVLKVLAGGLAVAAAVFLALRTTRSTTRRPPVGSTVVAGFAGGFLGPTTSLNGIAPALVLTNNGTPARPFIANLAAYFVASNVVTLLALLGMGHVALSDVNRYLAIWVPIGILGNLLGVHYAPRLPHKVFRGLTLTVVAVAGSVTVISTVL